MLPNGKSKKYNTLMEIKSYKEAVKYLDSFIKPVVFARIRPEDAALKDPLDRMRMLLKLLGNPQNTFKSVQVSGTSGKGSTAYLISHILTTAGYRTGFTMSPHLEKINERIQINGKPISDEDFIELVNLVAPAIERMKEMSVGEPSYFEITMAMAFLIFVQQEVDIAVVEVGMEGKYDASNTLKPIVAVLTNIDLDHTELLGETVEEIAKEAIEIIQTLPSKKEQIVITGVKQPSVIKIVEEKCKEVGAKLYRLGKDFELTKFEVSLLGDYQKENASLAVEVVRQLKKFGFKVSDDHVKEALKTAFFPGRFEILRRASLAQDKTSPTLVLDGAHNPAKMKAFIKALESLFPEERKIFVIAFKSDKDIKKMLAEIVKVADKIIVTRFHASMGYVSSGAMEADSIKHYVSSIEYSGKLIVEEDSKQAIKKAFEMAGKDDLIVVTGSLYLVGEVRSFLL